MAEDMPVAATHPGKLLDRGKDNYDAGLCYWRWCWRPLRVLAFNVPLSPQDGWPGSADRLWSQLGPWHSEGPRSCQSWTPGWAPKQLKIKAKNQIRKVKSSKSDGFFLSSNTLFVMSCHHKPIPALPRCESYASTWWWWWWFNKASQADL